MNTVFHTTLFCSLLAFAFGASTSVAAGSSDLTGDYNHGVQQYRQSQYDEAAMSFKRAAASSNDALAAKSRYNLGNSLYAKAANLISQPNQDQARLGDAQKSQPQKSNLGGSPLSATQSEQDTNPIELLEDAVGAYRSSLRLNPDDEDARFNLENATRLIDQIKEQQSDQNSSRQEQDQSQKQQEENQEDKPEQDSESKNEKPDENGDSEKPEGEEDAKEKNDPQEGGNEGEDDQKQPQESDQGSPGDQGADDQGDKPSGETQPDESQQKPGDAQSGSGSSAGQAAAKEMTAQEAKKMLQAIRDRDMQRRDRLESLKRSRRLIVPRDW